MVDLDRRLAAIAAAQHCLITYADVIAAGGSAHHIRERVRSGRWLRVDATLYRIAGTPWTYEVRLHAAILAAGPGAVASHACAARLHGMKRHSMAPIEISFPRGRNHRRTGVRIHQSTDLDRCGTVLVDGIPVTDAARTMLDLGRYNKVNGLTRSVEEARRLGLVTWSDLVRCLFSHARQGRHGVRRLRTVIAGGIINDGITDTDSELLALAALRQAGLPEPTLQHRIYDDDGRLVAELDVAYLDVKVNFEIDGDVHNDPVQQAKDDARDHELRTVYGLIVRRIPWHIPVEHPERFIKIVRQTLRDAGMKV